MIRQMAAPVGFLKFGVLTALPRVHLGMDGVSRPASAQRRAEVALTGSHTAASLVDGVCSAQSSRCAAPTYSDRKETANLGKPTQSATRPESRVTVLKTYVRPDALGPPIATRELKLRKRLGIVGDCHNGEFSPRQVLITASGAYSRLQIPRNSLRENVLIDTDRVEWSSGTELRIGKVVLRIMFTCEACFRLNAFRAGLMRKVGSDRGILARVVRGGTIRMGDSVRAKPEVYESLPHVWQRRLCRVLDKLPYESWVSYTKLAELTGVHKSYCRVFPRVLGFSRYGVKTEPSSGVMKNGAGELLPAAHGSRIRALWSGWHLFADENGRFAAGPNNTR